MTTIERRRPPRDTREPRSTPAHETALFHGATLQITKLDAKLAVARQALEQIATSREPTAAAVAVDALTKLGAGTAPTATVSLPPGGGPIFHSETSA